VKRGPAGFTPTQLAEKLGMAAPTLSFHLKGLQSAGLIDVRRAGRNLYYTADYPRMNALVQYLTQHCCALAEVACDTATCEPIEANLARSRRA
jgi:DNA-binding transcriptional ArsR family regulator